MLKRISAPAQVLSVADLKGDMLISHNEWDQKLTRAIQRAEAYIDGYTGILGKAMLSQQWTKTFTGFSPSLDLILGPLISVDSIEYYDIDDVEQTVASSVYRAHESFRGPYVVKKPNESWPATTFRDDAVTVTFTAGFGAAASDVPPNIIAAISLLAAHLSENTEAEQLDKTHPLVIGVYDLLHPSRKLI